jgi:transcription antitermination factor NusG
MSKAYRMMHDGPLRKRQLMPGRTPRLMRERDRTDESPLVAPPSAAQWHVAMSEPRREREAAIELERAGYGAWYPQETIWRERRDKRERTRLNQPLFPRYLFVALRPNADKPIRDCRHITGLLPYRPTAKTITELYDRQSGREFDAERAAEQARQALVGKPVRIADGPFASFNGIVTRAAHERIEILINVLGRLTPVVVNERNIAA